MRFKLQVDGKEYQVTATADGTIAIDGEVFETRTGAADPERRMIQVGEKNYEIRVAESTEDVGCFTLEVAGERVPLTVSELVREDPRAGSVGAGYGSVPVTGATSAGESAGGEVEGQAAVKTGAPAAEAKDGLFAPVPGKIVDVFVKPGDTVEEGAPLVVLEAMKMENELRAPKKGTVTAVLVQKGDTADRGQLLVGID